MTLGQGSTSCVLTINRRRLPDARMPIGHQQIEVIAGGAVVWRDDVAATGTAWSMSSPIDLSRHFVGRTTTLALRLAVSQGTKGDEATVALDDVSLTGCSVTNPTFEIDAGWTLTSSPGASVFGSVYQFSPSYSTDTFAALASLYALVGPPIPSAPTSSSEGPGTITRRAP